VERERETARKRGRDEVVRLKDGRALGMAHYGDPAGTPVFFFHGFPGSRFEGILLGEPAEAAGVHLIALDRPGFGLSDFAKGRTIGSWADDVAQVANQLGFDRFGAIGVSGGGPFVLACAARLADRLLGVAFVSGGTPPGAPTTPGMKSAFESNAKIFRLGRYVPIIPRGLIWYMARKTRRNPDDLREYLLPRVPPSDIAQLERDEVADVLRADQLEAMNQGSRGPAYEILLHIDPWDFRLEDIKIPVHVWQGDADVQVDPGSVRWLVDQLPNAIPHFIPGGGHYSVIIEEASEILAAAAERSTEQSRT